MPKSKQKNQTNLILVIALALAAVGYYSYRYMLTTPDINRITTERDEAQIKFRSTTVPKPPIPKP